MMMRRLVIAGCLLSVLGGGISSALADNPKRQPINLCIVTSDDPNHSSTHDFCITAPDPRR
jgi:hypothetical protein